MGRVEIQGHRGARGLRPENTLPSFEAALDVGVHSIETDLHLTLDGHVVLCHDPILGGLPVARQTLAELRRHVVDGNPDPRRFPRQDAAVPPLATRFATETGFHPHGVPTLDDLFAFVVAYAEDPGKPEERRRATGRVVLDLELKRVPGRPDAIGDGFVGRHPGLLEQRVAGAIRAAGFGDRCRVRSFDHRTVRAMAMLAPHVERAILVANTALGDPAAACRAAEASVFCPDHLFVDEEQVRRCADAGVRVLPWTANDPADWERLLECGVAGVTTDDPDRLRAWLGDP